MAGRVHLLVLLSVFATITIGQDTDGMYQCPEGPGWEIWQRNCYRFFNIRHSWSKAAELCRRYGSDLLLVDSFEENNYTRTLAEKSSQDEFSSAYWVGLMTLDDLSTDKLESASGELVSKFAGFWRLGEPRPEHGRCVRSLFQDEHSNQQSWELATCETLLPFMCKVQACPKGMFHCANGKCINKAFLCDRENDCEDMSDEMDCTENCHYYMRSSGDSIETPSYPQKYSSNLDCKWTLEGPEGYNIVLQFSEFDTEKNFDTVQILSGGKTEETAVNMDTISGRQDLSKHLFVSASNLMIIKFKTDASVEKKGFRASWKTEPQTCGGELRATPQPQVLTSPGYPENYPGGLECLYILIGVPSNIITLEIEDLELASERDYILVRDGDGPSSPQLARLTGTKKDNPRFVMSTSNSMYLYISTSHGGMYKGFRIKYFAGCDIEINSLSGNVSSPAFGGEGYPNHQRCGYLIRRPGGGAMSLKFLDFNLEDQDFVQVYDGRDANGIRLFTKDGFTGKTIPRLTLTAASGYMYIKFISDSIRTGRGWQAEFSADCPLLRPGEGAIASSRDTSFGTQIVFTCATGQEFASGVTEIRTKCMRGGRWSLTYIPQCQERYCGPVPQIDNGFSIGATNVTYQGQATYQCYAGFAFPSSMPIETITCTSKGKWEELPSCLASQCPLLPETPHTNQTVLNGGGRSYGTVIRFECEPGYERAGLPVILCMSNGTWSGPVPTCSKVRCHDLPQVSNGYIVEREREYLYGDEAQVVCHRGYQLVGSSTITCGTQRHFTNLPKCVDVNECSNPQCDAASTQCENMPGAFFCECKKGFTPNLDCRPIGDLGLASGGIPESAIKVSSELEGYEKKHIRLNSKAGWCGSFPSANSNWVRIDMSAPTVLRGFRMRPVQMTDGTASYASTLTLQSTNNLTDVFTDYRTPDGTPVEFRVPASAVPSVVNLPFPVEARYFQFNIQDYINSPCMRLELMGCSRQACTDENECAVNRGGCHQRCINSPGSFECGCSVGYELFTENNTAGFSIAPSETGVRDGDVYQLNKTCVPRRCPKLMSPLNGLVLSTQEMWHYGDTISFQCNFGYNLQGSASLKCLASGEWNGTVPECEYAQCAALTDNPDEGLTVTLPDIENPLVPFGENISISCNQIGKPLRNTVTSGFRECVYDPIVGFPFSYWLSGSPPGCPRVDCGPAPETPGATYGRRVDTRFKSSFYFGCEDTFNLAGQSSSNDNVIRCQEDGTWDFGDLRCEGPVCEDPGRPPDGIQIATSYEQGEEVTFACSRQGYIPFISKPITCIRDPECRVVKPIGISSGSIPDSAINATSERPNYEAVRVRLNDATGWCGQQEAFTYISVDLGFVHRVKAILVKGVITNDVVGRPTELRFFYKQQENDNYVIYFPNFNLTAREDPGNYGELSMITLPLSVKARFVILGIVSFDKNPCLKFELLGCEDEPEETRLLGYDMGYPACVDNETPQFTNCPSEAIIVQKGENGFLPVNFTVPSATDNSGRIARMEVKPKGFKPPLYVFEDMMVEYYAYDFDSNVAMCQILITVPDDIPPKISCPQSYVIELVEEQQSYLVNFFDIESRVNVTDNSNSTTLTFIPESSVIQVGAFENVTVVASDKYGNEATCHFQVSVRPTPCVAWGLKKPVHGSLNCIPNEDNTGLDCLASCNPGYRFTDKEPLKTYTCLKGEAWLPTEIVPDCVPEDTEFAHYDVVASVLYRSNGVVSEECLPRYKELLSQFYDNLNTLLSQRCFAATNVNVNVSFVDTKAKLREENLIEMDFVLRISPEIQQGLLYDLCGSNLGLIFGLDVLVASLVIEPLLNVSAVGNQCPPLKALSSSISRGFTCGEGEVLTEDKGGQIVPKCLHCPAGTYANIQDKSCLPCQRGSYQDQTRQSKCKRCPTGSFTHHEGSKLLSECIPVCGYGTYSPTGLVPCLECPHNSYTGMPPMDGYKECQVCPSNTFTYGTASYSASLCRAKCRPGSYSDTGLEPCSECPQNFYQPLEGQKSCFECATNELTLTPGANSRAQCEPVDCSQSVCENGGVCKQLGHRVMCYCPAGFSGDRCEVDIDECNSDPCYNGGTCVNQPQRYSCNCPPGYTGLQCQNEESDCKNDTCPERAMCQDLPGIGNFDCLCRSGYTGPDCNITVNPCTVQGNPCANEATCIPLQQGRFKCECRAGWEGRLCDENTDDCAENPCLLRANCTDLVNDFRCECPNGFTGKRCQNKVDLCAPSPCMHGLCVDMIFDHQCFCDPGWEGESCSDNIDECAESPCENNGECIDGINEYKCVCDTGYTGSRCQHTVNDCASEPCQNGGTCKDQIDGFYCICRPGYVGLQCEADIDECQNNPCNPVGTDECLDLDNAFKCKCRTGYTGEFCETNIDECASNPCLNGGKCTDNVARYLCSCPAGWTGERCEIDIGFCTSDPCQNSADCINLFQEYFCVCPSGTDGKRCETSPKRCIGDPCMNTGRCEDFGSGLKCSCPADYTGVGCQYEFDACKAGLCQNGATCIDEGPDYTCICPPGFTGRHCDQDIPDCNSASCPPAASCIDLTNDFYCKCPSNLTGEDCRKPINIEYDLFFNDETRESSASLAVPFPISMAHSFTVAFWVQFTNADDIGTFFTLYKVEKEILINNGQWHHIAVVWDSNGGKLMLTTDAVVAASLNGYGSGKMLDTNGWITLGAPKMEMRGGSDHSGFHGRISRVNVWKRALDTRSQIPKQVRSCQNAPVLFQDLLLRWTGYDRVMGNVERVTPATCGNRICPPGYTGDCSVLERDKKPPVVYNCPGVMRVLAQNGSTIVKWDEPEFRDNIKMRKVTELSGYKSGQLFDLGTYKVVYIGYDDMGNSQECSFPIYVLSEFCPVLEDPEGGTQRCSDWGAGYKICRIECDDGLKFSQPVPDFYSCGAEGFWRPTTDPGMPMVYPACAPARPAQRVFKIKINFPSSVICNNAGEEVLSKEIRAALVRLNKEWNVCSNTLQGSGSCPGMNVNVKCHSRDRVKRQDSKAGIYQVDVSFPAVADPVTNINSNQKATIQQIIQRIILEGGEFDISHLLPNVNPDPTSLVLDSDYTCPLGQVVSAPDCVECSRGTYYKQETSTCEPCPSGEYQNERGQTKCKQCPNIGRNQGVTRMEGARSQQDCKERCLPGYYYDEQNSLCRECGYGLYQPNSGEFSCLSCGHGLTTRTDRAVSKDECHEECASGLQLTESGKCERCPEGTFRTKGVDKTCRKCPAGTTTYSTGSSTEEECSLPICEPGTYLDSVAGNICRKCETGTYQDKKQQHSCIKCPQDTSTNDIGAKSKEECINPCETMENLELCDDHARCLLAPNGTFICMCMLGYNGTGLKDECFYKCDDYCENKGICSIDLKGEPKCECVGSFYGTRCDEKSQFAYIAGGIIGAGLLIIFVLFIIVMICNRAQRRKDPKKMLTPTADTGGSQVNFYYGAPAPYAESIAPSHHSTYAHYYDDEEDGWEMPNFYNDAYMKAEGLGNGKTNSLARSNASIYGRQEDLYDRLRKHAYPVKKEKGGNDTTSDSDDQAR